MPGGGIAGAELVEFAGRAPPVVDEPWGSEVELGKVFPCIVEELDEVGSSPHRVDTAP